MGTYRGQKGAGLSNASVVARSSNYPPHAEVCVCPWCQGVHCDPLSRKVQAVKLVTPPPPSPLCENNALVGATVGVVSASLGTVSYFVLYKYPVFRTTPRVVSVKFWECRSVLPGGGGGGAQTTPATTSTSSIRQLLGAADAQTAHHATFSTAPTHQILGSANAETTPARAPAAAADRKH